jgi:hypothetical protein
MTILSKDQVAAVRTLWAGKPHTRLSECDTCGIEALCDTAELGLRALTALQKIRDLYDTDEGCRSLPEYKEASAILAEAQASGKGEP